MLSKLLTLCINCTFQGIAFLKSEIEIYKYKRQDDHINESGSKLEVEGYAMKVMLL